MRIELRGAGGMAGSAAKSAGVSGDGGASESMILQRKRRWM